jgi:hypothetical protein
VWEDLIQCLGSLCQGRGHYFNSISNMILNISLCYLPSLDAEGFKEVCSQVAKPMKKAVRKTVEEAVFLVRTLVGILNIVMLTCLSHISLVT